MTIEPPIINPTEINKTTKNSVDVNKNPIKFKGKAMVEVKMEKKQTDSTRSYHRKQKYSTTTGPRLARLIGSWIAG